MNQFDKKDIDRAWELIKNAKKITLLTHFKPDGDGVSACAALSEVLLDIGKEVEAVYPNEPEFEFKRKPARVVLGEHVQHPDLLISCDTANYDRLYYPDDFQNIPMINIDHHVSNSINGTVNFVDAQASSAAEIVFRLLNEWNSSCITKSVAEALLIGILYDTQIFRTQSTHVSTLRVASDLIDKGANLFELKTELLSNKNPEIIKLWGLLLERIRFSRDKTSTWTYLTQADLKEFGLQLSSLIGFNDFLSDISQIDVTAMFYEIETGETKVSLRSKTRDVNQLAKQFGGGGHKNASGILSKKPLDQVMQEVTAEL